MAEPDWMPREGEFFMELPANVARLHKEGDELYAVLVDGRTIRLTDLFNEPKH